MRVEPLDTHQSLVSGSGSYYLLGHATGPLLRDRSYMDIEPHNGSMTTGIPRTEEEVTSFSPGVAQKLYLAPVGFLGAYLLPLAGDVKVQGNSAVSVIHSCSCFGGLSQTRFHTRVSKVRQPRYFLSIFLVIPLEMFV